MAGHSKWANIKHRKAAQDQKKAKIYAKAAKVIQLAATKGDDPSLNPALATALTAARQVGLSKDAIQKAIDTGAGNDTGEELFEIYYEGYGPGGVAMYIKAITSNTNRSGSNVRAIFTKYRCSMGTPNSVAWQFDEMGEIVIDGLINTSVVKGKEVAETVPFDKEALEMEILETSATDWSFEEDEETSEYIAIIKSSKEDYINLLDTLEKKNYSIMESGLQFFPQNPLSITDEEQEKLQRLIDALEEDDDVDTIWHSAE